MQHLQNNQRMNFIVNNNGEEDDIWDVDTVEDASWFWIRVQGIMNSNGL